MANKKSERTNQMKKDFMKLRESGMTIQEIAQKYGLTDRCVYLSLQEIADENNVSREELLCKPQKQHILNNLSVKKHREAISLEELKRDFAEILNSIDRIIENIDIAVRENNMEER